MCLVVAIVGLLLSAVNVRAMTTADLDPARSYKIERVVISGDKAFSGKDLLAVMTTRPRSFYMVWKPLAHFDPDAFDSDLKKLLRFYHAHGYYAATIGYDLAVRGDLVDAHIRVDERKPIRVESIDFEIKGGRPRPKRLDRNFKLPIRVGEIFNQGDYQSAAQELRRVYLAGGYAHAKVSRRAVVRVATREARVWYRIEPGEQCVFGPTTIVGTEHVAPEIIRRALAYRAGERFDPAKIEASRQKLLALNLFSAIDFDSRSGPNEPSVVPITLTVSEGPPRTLTLGGGYNTQTLLNATIAWNHYNFMGDGRQLTLQATYSNIATTFDVKLLQPYLFSPQSSLTLEALQQQQYYQTYNSTMFGFDPHLDYAFTPSLTGFLGYRAEYLRFNAVNASTINGIGGLRRRGMLSGPNAGLAFNNTEDPLNPQSGEILTLFANVSDHLFGADYRYWRALAEARKYQLIGWETVLAMRFKTGFENTLGDSIENVPLSERFYSGGEGSVRGYGLRRIGPLSASDDPLGGLSLVEGSIELRRALFWKISGAAFFDCGQVALGSFRFPVSAMQCGYGPAASVNTPVGPLRVDIGFPTRRPPGGDSSYQFYFSIGQYF